MSCSASLESTGEASPRQPVDMAVAEEQLFVLQPAAAPISVYTLSGKQQRVIGVSKAEGPTGISKRHTQLMVKIDRSRQSTRD